MLKLKWQVGRTMEASLGIFAVAAMIGCSNAADDGNGVSAVGRAMAATPTAATQATLNVSGGLGDSLAKYRLFIPTRSSAETRDRAQTVARILARSNVAIAKTAELGRDWSSPLDSPTLKVSYDGVTDYLKVKDTTTFTSKNAADVGEQSARDEMKKVVGELAAAGLIKSQHYDLSAVETGHHRRMIGNTQTHETTQKVMEYRYFVPRKINGIEVASAAIMVGIAPSGNRSSIQIGGVEADSVHNGIEERPLATGGIVKRAVTPADTDQRFAAEIAKDRTLDMRSKGLTYMLPLGVRDSVVEPKMVYRYAETAVSSTGSRMIADVAMASFSLTNKNAKHELIDALTVDAPPVPGTSRRK